MPAGDLFHPVPASVARTLFSATDQQSSDTQGMTDTVHPPTLSLAVSHGYTLDNAGIELSKPEQQGYMKFSDNTNVFGSQKSSMRQAIAERTHNWLRGALEAEWGNGGCRQPFESSRELVKHMSNVIGNCTDNTKRRCRGVRRNRISS